MKITFKKLLLTVCLAGLSASFSLAGSNSNGNEGAEKPLLSPDGRIGVSLSGKEGEVSYSVQLDGNTIIASSSIGLKADSSAPLSIFDVSRSSGHEPWEAVWGSRKLYDQHYNEIRLKVGGGVEAESVQTIVLRAYDDGLAFRYELPESRQFSEKDYRHEVSEVSFVSKKPILWHPLSSTLVSDAVDVNSWEPARKDETKVNKNTRYSFMPFVMKTPVTLKLSDAAYISVHEAAITQSDAAGVNLVGNTLTYSSNIKTAGGFFTPWRTISIEDRPGGLIESTLIENLNEPSKLEDTSWIKPGKTMWDWRNHGAHADDGFEYGITTESYIRYIDFATENNVEYVLVDAEWYGPERKPDSDPKTYLPQIDIPKLCAYANSKGVAMWLYVNTKGLSGYDLDETFSLYQKWGVAGIKHGFLNGSTREHVEFGNKVVEKCAEYHIQYVLHEPYKPSGLQRTYPNIFSYEYVNSMLDGPSRPSATPSRLINSLFVHALVGPVDRSCCMFDLDTFISREKCHRQLPSTVVSQAAQCLLFPTGLLTLPDHPDAYRRKLDLFEFIAQLPMTWNETKVLEAEIGEYITMARSAGEQWFVASLADENGRDTSIALDFLEEGVRYDVTLYEDAPDAHYQYSGPGTKKEAKAAGQEMKPHDTKRELYQVRKITAHKGDIISIKMAPGGGHCMWIRPSS